MNLKTLFIGASSACFELENDEPYYAPEKFKVLLNSQEQYECESNVFSLYALRPDTEYSVEVRGGTLHGALSFRTRAERCAIDVRSFDAKGDGLHTRRISPRR